MQIIITAIIVLVAFWLLIKRLRKTFTAPKDCSCSASSCDGCPYANQQIEIATKK